MRNKDFKQWLIWNAGGGGAAVGLLIIFLLLVGSDISSRAAGIGKNRENIKLRIQALNSLATLKTEAERADRLLPQLQNALPAKQSDRLLGFSKFLESGAKANQLSNFGFAFENEVSSTETTPGINNFILTLSGQHSNLLKFLKSVESGSYFVGFMNLDLASREGKFDMTLKGRVFSD